MPLCLLWFSLCVAIHLMDHIDDTVSCMIIGEPMSLLKPLYRECVGIASYVHNRTHSSSVHGLYIDSWSRDATLSSVLHILFQGFISISTSQLLCPTSSLFVPFSMTFMY